VTFIKWVGGKVNLLSTLDELLPNMRNMDGYIEPFLGGGSVFFHIKENYGEPLENKPIYLSDVNPNLINTYRSVRDNIKDLIPLLQKHEDNHNEEYYYKIRDIYPPGNELSNIEKAACFIYLNKACFNGLWRVNSEGKNNVAIGYKHKVPIYDKNELLKCSSLLKGANLNVMSYENIVKIKNVKNYFVYLDPPYLQIDNKSNNFTGYSPDAFHLAKKILLSKIFKELDKLGCKVMLSNSYAPIIEKEYKDFNILVVDTKRSANTFGGVTSDDRKSPRDEKRKSIDEVIVTNYVPVKKQKTIDDSWS
jgi:DNA adenine methylase